MKIFITILLINSFLFAKDVVLPEATVAVVNGIAITDNELDREVSKLLPRSYFHSTVNEEKLKNLKNKAMDSLIENTLLYNYAISEKIDVSDDKLEDVIESIEEAYGSEEKFKAGLKSSDFTMLTFKKAVKKELVLEKFKKEVIEYSVTDKELKDYYEKNMFKFKEPEKIKVSMIYSRNEPTDSNGSAKAKYKIEKALDELNKGENFAYVAQTYSDDMSRVMGGDMGFIHKGRLDMDLEKIAFNMESNTTSEIIRKDVGFYIIRVDEIREPNQLKFEDIKNKLSGELKAKEEKKRKSDLLKTLMSKAVIIKKQ